MELANGQRIPSVNRPSKGPRVIPLMTAPAYSKRHTSILLPHVTITNKYIMYVFVCPETVMLINRSTDLPASSLP